MIGEPEEPGAQRAQVCACHTPLLSFSPFSETSNLDHPQIHLLEQIAGIADQVRVVTCDIGVRKDIYVLTDSPSPQ